MSDINITKKIQYKDFDILTLEEDKKREKYIHDLIINEQSIQKDLMSILELEDIGKLNLIHEDRYINGIIADFTLIHDSFIRAIIECKAGDIGVTDYVRGIGQVLQYEYFFEQKISKNLAYSQNFNSILLFPSSVVKNNLLNIGRFKYPKTTIIVEINEVNKVTRQIALTELEKLGQALDNNLTTISQYYIRDNRLFELYLLLKYLIITSIKGEKSINRRILEKENLQKLNTPNNQNWRNAFISLSSLGLINSKNLPTPSGFRLGSLPFEEFLLMIYKSYLKPYIDTILNYFVDSNSNLSNSNQIISENLKKMFDNQDVLFLTQSNGRYISSWLNVLRDDYGCIDFSPRSKDRSINFNISQLNDKTIIENIKRHSHAYTYLDNFKKIVN